MVRPNRDGLRDDDFLGSMDIAAIGDSFTFDFDVEAGESWPERLGRISSMDVANFGWAGWDSYVYLVMLQLFAVLFEVQIWILSFFGNALPESADAEIYFNSG